MNVTGVCQNLVSAFIWKGWHVASMPFSFDAYAQSADACMHVHESQWHACLGDVDCMLSARNNLLSAFMHSQSEQLSLLE